MRLEFRALGYLLGLGCFCRGVPGTYPSRLPTHSKCFRFEDWV